MRAGRVEVRRDSPVEIERWFRALCDPQSSTPPGFDARGGAHPLQIGSSWETVPQPGAWEQGRRAVSRVEVVAYEPPRHLGLRRSLGSLPQQLEVDYYLTPRAQGGTRIEVGVRLAKRLGCLGWLLGLPVQLALRGGVAQLLLQQLETLEAQLAGSVREEGGRGPDGGVS